jgi:hypothetical protein
MTVKELVATLELCGILVLSFVVVWKIGMWSGRRKYIVANRKLKERDDTDGETHTI